CPDGIATQNPVLRKRFTGKPEFVENFFLFLAEEVRGYLAELGFRTLDEAVGRVELLDFAPAVERAGRRLAGPDPDPGPQAREGAGQRADRVGGPGIGGRHPGGVRGRRA